MRKLFMYGGTQKAASTWIHAALRASVVDTSPVKEWHYWDSVLGGAPGIPRLVEELGRPLSPLEFTKALGSREVSPPGPLSSLPPRPLQDVWPGERGDYPRLLRSPRGALAPRSALSQWTALMRCWTVGDFTPANAVLLPAHWSEITTALPGIHVIFGVRNPTTRLWSAIRMYLRAGWLKRAPNAEEAVLIARAPGMAERSRMSQNVAHLQSTIRSEQVLLIGFDDVVQDPAGVLARVSEFIGARLVDPGPVNSGQTLPIPPAVREALDDHFGDEVHALEGLLGRRVVD